jgi:hypothetical protein
LIRYVAVAFNVLAVLLQLNVEIADLVSGQSHAQSIWIRAEQLAPVLALIALLWPPAHRGFTEDSA